jgi:hypothetical protein
MSEKDRERLRRALRDAKSRLDEKLFVAFERDGECLVIFVAGIGPKNSVDYDQTLRRTLAWHFHASKTITKIAAHARTGAQEGARPSNLSGSGVIDLDGARRLAQKVSAKTRRREARS